MLSFLLAPLLVRLQRWGLGRIPALLIVISLVIGAMAGLGFVVYAQLHDLAEKLPQYQANIEEKVTWVRRFTQSGAFDKAFEVIKRTTEKATTQPTTTASTQTTALVQSAPGDPNKEALIPVNPGAAPVNPIPVVVTNDGSNPFKNFYKSVAPLIDPLATGGIVIIFVIFMLMTREDLRDRVIRLIGQGRINVTTRAMDEAATRVSRYLIAQCIVNGTYGLAIALGLWIIGMTVGQNNPSFPNWFLWGLLTGLLRFIPYIGPWIGAAFPIAISLAVYHGMNVPLAVIGMFLLIELLSNNLMEPWLYGTSTGVSTVAILVSAVFWTWLWGTPGLLLSTPLTVLIAVTGKYVPQLEFLNILLGDEPALEPKYRFYQRLLADDLEEADELLAEYVQEKPLVRVYDEVVLPALSLAEHDWHDDRLDQGKQAAVRRAVRELVEEIGERPQQVDEAPPGERASETIARSSGVEATRYERCIICLPARDEADEIAAIILAQILEQQGYCSQCVSVEKLASEYIDLVEKNNAQVVVISALPPAAVTHARYIAKRLRARFPELKIVVGLWTLPGNMERARHRLRAAGADAVVGTLEQAVEQVRQIVQPLIVAEAAEPVAAK
jgi:predicted PurR-regulated permease PerM/methylmalonyl-CoA mutase cobalamin-binding subunit